MTKRTLRRRRPPRLRDVSSRRRFLVQGTGLVGAGWAAWRVGWNPPEADAADSEPPIRPPTASPDDDRFRDACIRCGMCGIVCENGCIRFYDLGESSHGALTPYLDVRERSCTLCMRCTQVCPTSALREVEDDLDRIVDSVNMGTAEVDPDRCLSYLGRICGVCYDACPLPGRAIRLTPPGKPVVLAEACVGCGRCVENCPQVPTAIDVRRPHLEA